MSLTVDTTTIPGYTIITDGTGGIAVLPTPPEDSTVPSYTIQNEIVDKLSILGSRLEDISSILGSRLEDISKSLTDIESSLKTVSQKATLDSENLKDIRDIILGEKEVVGAGIPIKDSYAALAYSSLIKVFEEEGVNIDALIEKTKSKLRGL